MKPRKTRRRWIWIAAIALLIVAALVWGFRPQPIEADTAIVERAPLRVTVEEEGKTRARDRYVISAPLAGFLRRLEWDAGDRVRSGDVVARIGPPRPQALDARTREQAEARVRVAEAALRAAEQRARTAEEQARAAQVDAGYAQRELARMERLRATDDVSAADYDKAAFEARRTEAALKTAEQAAAASRVDVDTARAEVRSARAALVTSEVARADGAAPAEVVHVRSPVSGRVLRVVRESEGVVNPGEPLLEIANARALEVEVDVLSADAVRIAPGGRVVFTRWGGTQPLDGRVRVVEPTGFTKVSALGVEEQRVHVIADLTSPEEEWSRLGDGYRVEASFILWESDSVLQIPANALFHAGDEWAVFVVEGGVARRRIVEVGHRTGLAVEIVSGLKEGERVITHPDDAVADGKRVECGAGHRFLWPAGAADDEEALGQAIVFCGLPARQTTKNDRLPHSGGERAGRGAGPGLRLADLVIGRLNRTALLRGFRGTAEVVLAPDLRFQVGEAAPTARGGVVRHYFDTRASVPSISSPEHTKS